jgi:glycosyltransferase involved in cell wall biosynthesis
MAQTLAREIGWPCLSVLAKNESTPHLKSNLREVSHLYGTGSAPSRLRTIAFCVAVAVRALIDRPELIITTHLHFAPAASWLKTLLGIPFWVSLHGIDAWNLSDPTRQRALYRADLLLPVSEHTAKRVQREQGIDPARFRLLPNAIDWEQWTPGPKPLHLLERYGIAADTPVILTVGRLCAREAYKGQDRIIRVLREVREHRPGVRYVIVGDGDDRERLERIAAEEQVNEAVTFAGKVPREELLDHYRLCDVFAMPSSGEGFGIVFLEALACGRPVIAGNADGAAEILSQTKLGILVDADQPAQLRDEILAALPAPGAESVVASEKLRAAVVERFGVEKFAASLRGYLGEFRAAQNSGDKRQKRAVNA